MNGRWPLAMCLPFVAAAQRQCNDMYWLKDFTVAFRTVSNRPGSAEQACGETTDSGDSIRRVLYDVAGKPYFGYEIRVTGDGDDRSRVELAPINNSALRTFAKFPRPAIVRADEIVDVTVLEKPASSPRRTEFAIPYWNEWLMLLGLQPARAPASFERVTDYLQIVRKGKPWAGFPRFAGWAETPPEGTVLTLDRPRLSNSWGPYGDLGKNDEMGVIGPVVWLYREGLGRFLFSASARPGFQKSALVQNAFLQFSGEQVGLVLTSYTVGLHSNALPTPGSWMIWVKHEPDFRPPPGPWTDAELKNGMLALGVER